MRDKRFSETRTGRTRPRSHPPAPSSPASIQLARPAFPFGDVLIDATPKRLREQFGRVADAERAALRDMRIENNRLAAIIRSDRAVRRHIIAMAQLERELQGATVRLRARVHQGKKRTPGERRTRKKDAPIRRLPRIGIEIVDKAGQRGIFVEITSVGADQKRYRSGCARTYFAYIWADNAVEKLASGELSRCSNMGPTPEIIGDAMDLKEDVARASRANANIEIRIIVRLPHDISPEGRLLILKRFCKEFLGRNGLPYAAAVHPPDPHSDQHNYHGHIQASFRPMRYVGGQEWEVGTELRTDLSRREGVRLLRATIADAMTEVSRDEGRNRVYTSLSLQERGLNLKPLRKVGQQQTEAYRRGEHVGVVEENKRIIAENLKRYTVLRNSWLEEKLATAQRLVPKVTDAIARTRKTASSAPGPAAKIDAAGTVQRPSWSGLEAPNRAIIGSANTIEKVSRTPLSKPISPSDAASERPAVEIGNRVLVASRSRAAPREIAIPTFPKAASAVPVQIRPAVPSLLAPPWMEPSLNVPPSRRTDLSRIKVPLPLPERPTTAGLGDAMVLLQLRAAQENERKTFAIRRRALLDNLLFRGGQNGNPTPDYAAFLQTIRDDPAVLRWQLDGAGRRRAPVLGKADETFANRFHVYMQHPNVQRQVQDVLERVYEPGAPWPDALRHGMWKYEAGRHGHRAMLATRAKWHDQDAVFSDALGSRLKRGSVLEKIDDLVLPELRAVNDWGDHDLVRLLYPAAQEKLAVAYHEQREQRVECLAAIASGEVRIERRVEPAEEGRFRTVVELLKPSPGLADAFLRRRNDAEFYVETAQGDPALATAHRRRSAVPDLAVRAWLAASEAGEQDGVLRRLADQIPAGPSLKNFAVKLTEAAAQVVRNEVPAPSAVHARNQQKQRGKQASGPKLKDR